MRARRIAALALAGVATLGVSACGSTAFSGATPPKSSAPTHQVHLTLATGDHVDAALPSKPLGSTPTSVSGVKLEVWQVQRSGSTAQVVFSLHDTNDQNGDTSDQVDLGQYLDANDGNTAAVESGQADGVTSDVGLLDTSSLKEYEAYCDQDSDGVLTNCLASKNDVSLNADSEEYFAALVDAPPSSTTSVTVVTGVGSIQNVPVSG